MSTDIVAIRGDSTLLEAMKLLVNANVTALPVVDEGGAPVGLLSDHDLIRQILREAQSGGLHSHPGQDGSSAADAYTRPVRAAMTTPVATLPEDCSLEDIAALIMERQHRLIPIVRGKTIVGIVGRNELVKALLSRAPDGAGVEQGKAVVADEDLRRAVTTAVIRLGVAVGGGFDVVARHGIVHLWGEVSDEADHQACRVAAMKVPGVRDVLNHMQIISPARRMVRRNW